MKEQVQPSIVVERVQTGVRMEKRLLKVLKGLAELKDMTLGDLLEGIVLHAFEQIAKSHVFQLSQTLQYFEQSFLHADAGLHALDDDGVLNICCHGTYVPT